MKYNDIAFLPVDLPPIQNKQAIVDNFKKEISYGWWDAIRMFEPTVNFEPTNKWSQAANEKFSGLKDFMNVHLPYTDFIHSKIMKSREAVLPHVDYQDPKRMPEVYSHLFENEPASYRIVISGDRHRGLYLCRGEEVLQEQKVYVQIPETTDVYLMPYTNQFHGVDFEKDRIIVITNGYIDRKRHFELIDRSLEKYGTYMVRRSDLP